ncbi:MAG TPA: hypothetical protein VGI14_02665 [Casimicrobiaceae bacterium]|jgi:hypothetical protein
MHRVAIPFADFENGARAVDSLVRAPRDAQLEVELVAMADPLRPGKVAVFVSSETAQAQVRAAAQQWLAQLGAKLEAASIPHRAHIAVGPVTATLRGLAHRRDLARIVLAHPREAWWRTWLRHVALRGAAPAVTVVP